MRRHLYGYFNRMRGLEAPPSRARLSHVVWSAIGSFLGIYLISILNQYMFMNASDTIFLVGSFGASAVLIYGVPHAELSQPRNLIGGHIISALIGITVYKFFPLEIPILSALAVSLSIIAMHLTRTLHPPGGATALIAVIGSSQVHELGYMFVITPIATGAFILLVIALVVNNMSNNPMRHYPRYWW